MFEKSALGSLVERQQGGGTPERNNPRFWNGPIPWASVKDFADDQLVLISTEDSITQQGLAASSTNLIPAGTPLVCTRMAVGRCAISNCDVSINQDVKALFPKVNVSPRYLLRVLDSLKSHAESVSVGSTVKGIRISDLLGIQTPIAPPDEQPKITQILDTLDTKIQKTEALIAKLGKIKEGLLQDLLTRGIDQTGQLRPSPEQAPELYKESALGLIPKEWEETPLGQVAESMVDGPFGSNLKTSHYVEEAGVQVVRLQNIKTGEYDETFTAFITRAHANRLDKNRVVGGDLLVAALGDEKSKPGRACLYPAHLPPAINKADCFRVRTNPSQATNSFLMHSLNFGRSSKQATAKQQGVTLQRVNLSNLRTIVIGLPTIAEQRLISDQLNAIVVKINALKYEKQKLESAKNGLMDDLLTGRVRVTPLLKDSV
jgi:type I restriction enzyme S subunit